MSSSDTVLVIDDEEAMLDSCSQALEKSGYSVEIAESGENGLRIAERLVPDLVLVDLKMPGISGMDVLKRIKEIDPTIVTVVITGYGTVDSAVEAMKRDAYDFLTKPFTPNELRRVVAKGIEKRKLQIETSALREEKERLRESFVTIVSHQLRSPLATVRQYLEVVLSGAIGKTTDEIQQMLQRSAIRIDELMDMVNDWLNMARIDAGKLTESFELVDLVEVLKRCVDSHKQTADEKNVQISFSSSGSLPKVEGDAESLFEAFSNLIDNAIKYNRPNGKVSVDTKNKAHRLVVTVSDTGFGIDEDSLPFIFDDFYRAKNKYTREITGTGLGLPITKKIIEAHSGEIQVDSKLGEGTVFTVSFPIETLHFPG
jgi:signal transduction histidine kinase